MASSYSLHNLHFHAMQRSLVPRDDNARGVTVAGRLKQQCGSEEKESLRKRGSVCWLFPLPWRGLGGGREPRAQVSLPPVRRVGFYHYLITPAIRKNAFFAGSYGLVCLFNRIGK